MAKLQRILRKDGTKVHSVNIPSEIISQTNWNKGDELQFQVDEQGRIIIENETVQPKKLENLSEEV